MSENIPEVSFMVEVAETVQTPIDDTLTIEGMAADAKATGDAINQAKADLQEEIDAIDGGIDGIPGTLFPVGAIYVSTSSTAPTFGTDWTWQEIMIPMTWGDLEDGARSFTLMGESDTPGTIHFWLRTA